MMSVNRFIPDAAYAIRAADAAAMVADTPLTAGKLVSPVDAIWNDAVKDGKVVVFYKASGVTITTDEAYAIEVITSANEDLSAAQVHYSVAIDAGDEDAWKEILIDQHSLLKDDTDAKYWGINVNVSGTAPSISVEAYVLPPVGK